MSLNYPIPRISCGCFDTVDSVGLEHVVSCKDGIMVFTPISSIRSNITNNITIDGLSSLSGLTTSTDTLNETTVATALLVGHDGIRKVITLDHGEMLIGTANGIEAITSGLLTFDVSDGYSTEIYDSDLTTYSEFTTPTNGDQAGRATLVDVPSDMTSTMAKVALTVSADIGHIEIDLMVMGDSVGPPVIIDASRPQNRPVIFSFERVVKVHSSGSSFSWATSISEDTITLDEDLDGFYTGPDIAYDYTIEITPLYHYVSVVAP